MDTIVVSDYLTWERAEQASTATAPMPCAQYYPEWWKNLSGDIRKYLPASGDHRNHTARLCMGLRGSSQLGWCVPLDVSLMPGRFLSSVNLRQQQLLQEMLHGSQFAEKDDQGYVWDQPRILAFPWRARMAPGWRLLMTVYPLDWSTDWHAFTGMAEANHGSGFWGWSTPMDPDYHYYNVETVVVLRRNAQAIQPGRVIFAMVPVYQPDYVPAGPVRYPF